MFDDENKVKQRHEGGREKKGRRNKRIKRDIKSERERVTVKESGPERAGDRNRQIGIIRMHAGTCFLPGQRLAVLVSPSC